MTRRPTEKQLRAWREARVQSYISTRSIDALARMVVELEDDNYCVPEFELDDEWPNAVQHMKVRR